MNVDVRRTAIVSVLVGLSFIGTTFIRIPIPATNGYFNLGDMFVILAGLWLGAPVGFVVGAIGPTLSDAIGFPQFILATLVTKGCEGFVAGLVSKAKAPQRLALSSLAAGLSAIVMVFGYFIFEAFVYPLLAQRMAFFNVTDLGGALGEVGPNIIQGLIGAVGGIALWRLVSGSRS